jgi:hypothetical protein
MPAPGNNRPNFGPRKPEARRAETLTGQPVVKPNIIHRTTMNWILKKILPFLINWKTTLAGVGLIAHAISSVADQLVAVADGGPLTLEGLHIAWGEIIGGIGLIAARDANKSSQDSSIRK